MHKVTFTCFGCGLSFEHFQDKDLAYSVSCRRCGRVVIKFAPLAGYIYLLSNESMPGLVKIGSTSRNVAERIEELSRVTGVAMPFVEEASFAVEELIMTEQRIHESLKNYRVNQNREFFKMTSSLAFAKMEHLLGAPFFVSGRVYGHTPAKDLTLELAKERIRERIRKEPLAGERPFGGFGSDRYT